MIKIYCVNYYYETKALPVGKTKKRSKLIHKYEETRDYNY